MGLSIFIFPVTQVFLASSQPPAFVHLRAEALWKGVVLAAVVEMSRRTGLVPKQIHFTTAPPVPELGKRKEGLARLTAFGAQLPLCSHS